MSSSIAIATWSSSEYVDPEAVLVADELRRRGHDAAVVHWDAALDWAGFDLVVVRSTWDYFERLHDFLHWAQQVDAASRIVNPLTVIRWNCHKGYLAELAAAGVPVLPSLPVGQGAPDAMAALEQVAADGWDHVVLKPAVDGGARLALKTRASAPEAVEHLARLVAAGDAIVQPYAPSVELGETSLFFFGGLFSHAVRKVPKPGDSRVRALHGGSEEWHEPSGAELEVARAAMDLAPGELTYARADFIDVDGRPTLMELELIEPDLFLRMSPDALHHYVDALEVALP